VKIIRPTTEAEAIAEFLKSEFYQKEYHADRRLHETLVMNPNLTDAEENRIRRNLLYRRHRVTWNELPSDVRWFQVQLEIEDVARLRVFPRGHWPKLKGGGSMAVEDIARSIRQRDFSADVAEDVSAIQAIAYRLRHQPDNSSVLLIGVDPLHPMTILEGNHRVVAAALTSRECVTSFNTYAGFSTSMTSCFWYETNLENMVRYACRRLLDVQPDLFRGWIQRWAA
jgi:hypothetical protein